VNLAAPEFKPWQEVLTLDPTILAPFVTEGMANLNFGCAGRPIKGWKNYDPNIKGVEGIDHQVDFEEDFYQGAFGTIVAWHVLEHIHDTGQLFGLMRTFYNLLAPGGHFIAACPYAQSKEAFSSPFHIRYFTDQTWSYFIRKPYEMENTMGYMANEGMWIPPWDLVCNIRLIDTNKPKEVVDNHDSYWNVTTDTVAVFRK
jgi:SAM-dependent methyltransferase